MVTILNGNNDTYFFTGRCLTGNSSFIDRWILKRENHDAYQIYQGLLYFRHRVFLSCIRSHTLYLNA